jgi:hypothetical protein
VFDGLALRAVGRDGVASRELPELDWNDSPVFERDCSVFGKACDGNDFAVCEFAAIGAWGVGFDLQPVALADGEVTCSANRQAVLVLALHFAQLASDFENYPRRSDSDDFASRVASFWTAQHRDAIGWAKAGICFLCDGQIDCFKRLDGYVTAAEFARTSQAITDRFIEIPYFVSRLRNHQRGFAGVRQRQICSVSMARSSADTHCRARRSFARRREISFG